MIKVNEFYRGRATNEQAIAPGEYAEDAPELFGLAEFLVESGRAERIGNIPSPESVQGGDAPDAEEKKPGRKGKKDGGFLGFAPDPKVVQAAHMDAEETDDADHPTDDRKADAFLDSTNRPRVEPQ